MTTEESTPLDGRELTSSQTAPTWNTRVMWTCDALAASWHGSDNNLIWTHIDELEHYVETGFDLFERKRALRALKACATDGSEMARRFALGALRWLKKEGFTADCVGVIPSAESRLDGPLWSDQRM